MWLGLTGDGWILRNSYGATRASSSKQHCLVWKVTVVSVHDFTKCWSWYCSIFLIHHGDDYAYSLLVWATLLILLNFRWVRYSSPLLHRLTTCNQYWILLNYFEYSTPVQRTSKCNMIQYYDIIHSVFSLKSFFLETSSKKDFPNLPKFSLVPGAGEPRDWPSAPGAFRGTSQKASCQRGGR